MDRYTQEYRHGFYYVYDRKYGVMRPGEAIARCDKLYDAERIVDALNKAVSDG